jgi:hypothetical protein
VTRGGGGGGGGAGGAQGSGGSGGGGAGGANSNGTAGSANTGGGGGGAGDTDDVSFHLSGNGGSGVVILRYADTFTITIGAGLTGSTTTSGANKITTLTAGSGNVSWS